MLWIARWFGKVKSPFVWDFGPVFQTSGKRKLKKNSSAVGLDFRKDDKLAYMRKSDESWKVSNFSKSLRYGFLLLQILKVWCLYSIRAALGSSRRRDLRKEGGAFWFSPATSRQGKEAGRGISRWVWGREMMEAATDKWVHIKIEVQFAGLCWSWDLIWGLYTFELGLQISFRGLNLQTLVELL
jgi:hypothetical protein